MRIAEEAVRSGMQLWAREQSSTLEALQRALEVVYRERPGARSLDELATALLLSVARRHEGRVDSALGRLDGALGRLLDDVESLRTVASEGRAPALREADLHAVAEALAEMVRFEDRVRFMLDTDAPDVQSTMRQLLATPAQGTPVGGTGVGDAARAAAGTARGTNRTVRQSLELARHLVVEAEEVLSAWRQGWTREPAGVAPVRVPWPNHPVLAAEVRRMQGAVDAFRAAAPGLSDPVAAVRAVEDLQGAVSRGNETLRAFGRRFESTVTGDRLPPSGGVPAGMVPQPGSPAADALAAVGRLAALPNATPTASELFDALRFSDLDVRATGTLSEPLARNLPGVGQERYVLRPSEIRVLPTSPPWLAGRLADLVQGWQRAHLLGPGFGGELFTGLMLAPRGVNQLAQNRGAERILRQLAAGSRAVGGPEITPTVRATGRRLAVPLANGGFEYVDLLTSVHYELPRPNGPPVRIDISVDPGGGWRVSHTPADLPWPAGVPRSGAR